jgi:phenylalanyl-tRNA synthetase beta chain
MLARVVGVQLEVRADDHAPFHPGRCAALSVGDQLLGHAGELHPRVVDGFDLPARCCAMELSLDRLIGAAPDSTATVSISAYPAASIDVAVAVPTHVPSGEVAAALTAGAGELLESLRLFDVYQGDQLDPGQKSLAFTLRLRASDRTLTAEEVAVAREAAVAEAARRWGAVLR